MAPDSQRFANLCCGHLACQDEARAKAENAWEQGYRAALLSAPKNAPTADNPYAKKHLANPPHTTEA